MKEKAAGASLVTGLQACSATNEKKEVACSGVRAKRPALLPLFQSDVFHCLPLHASINCYIQSNS